MKPKQSKVKKKLMCQDCGSEDYPYHEEFCMMGFLGWEEMKMKQSKIKEAKMESLSEKEKIWLKEGINWKTDKIHFIKKEEKLYCEKIKSVKVDIDPLEFVKKIGLVEDGISQTDLNKALDGMMKDY